MRRSAAPIGSSHVDWSDTTYLRLLPDHPLYDDERVVMIGPVTDI
jgi:hypothetical protein